MPPGGICKAALSVVRKHLSPLPERCHSLQTRENGAYGVAAGATFGVWCLLQAQGTCTSAGGMKNGGTFLTYSVCVFNHVGG